MPPCIEAPARASMGWMDGRQYTVDCRRIFPRKERADFYAALRPSRRFQGQIKVSPKLQDCFVRLRHTDLPMALMVASARYTRQGIGGKQSSKTDIAFNQARDL